MSNEVATQGPKPEIVKFREQLDARAGEIKMALPQHITPEKFQRTIITACQSDPELLKADRASLVLACMKAAQDGLLPDKRESAIVIFKENKKTDDGWITRLIATYMPMVYGLRKKILQSGDVVSLEVGVVYRAEVEAGKFLYEVGLEPPLRHRPMLELTLEQTKDSEIVAAYSIATMKDGTKSFEVMRRFEIDKVRETSKTGATKDRNGKPRTPSGPWVDWFAEMAKKTVMRRHAKTLPQSGDIIIDVEGQEEEAGASTAALLASRSPDAPLIEDRSDDLPPHDKETGELLDDDSQDDGDQEESERKEPEQKQEKKARAPRKAKDKPEPASAEGNAGAHGEEKDQGRAEPPATTGDAAQSDALASSSNDQPADEERASEDESDQLGESDSDAINDFQIVAEDLITSFKKAATVIDLERLYNDSDEARSTMPEEIASVVESSYQIEKRRLKGGASG